MYKIEKITEKSIPALAKTYAEVFAGAPWFEVSRCEACGGFGKTQPEEAAACSCGKGTFNLAAYPPKSTGEYIQREVFRQTAVGLWLSFCLQDIIEAKGFSWGYTSNSEGFQKKYQTPEMQGAIAQLLVTSGAFFYISEVGILPQMQGQGLGKTMMKALLAQAPQNLPVLLRTNEDSGLRYISEKLGMRPILGLKTGLSDTENEKRVVFWGSR